MKRIVKKEHLKEGGKILAGVVAGFSLFLAATHPKSFVHKKIPQKRIKNVSVLPSVKVHWQDNVFHLHHWLIFTFFYIPLLISKRNILKSKIMHGFVIGAIIQGLTYRDFFRIVYNSSVKK